MSASSPIIRHVHLTGITSFARASFIQDRLARQLLDHKALPASASSSTPPTASPAPTILTFSPTSVYTTGRRELNTPLSPATLTRLQTPLNGNTPTVQATLRGGQITYHGPGQLVVYPILDLRAVGSCSSRWAPRGLSARCYVNVLEEATIRTLRGSLGISEAARDAQNPGVWVSPDEKIAALGVHLRRNVSSYGVGINVSTDLRFFDRIVACGLEGKRMTSVERELFSSTEKSDGSVDELLVEKRKREEESLGHLNLERMESMRLENVATAWVREFKDLVWGDMGHLETLQLDGNDLQTPFPGLEDGGASYAGV